MNRLHFTIFLMLLSATPAAFANQNATAPRRHKRKAPAAGHHAPPASSVEPSTPDPAGPTTTPARVPAIDAKPAAPPLQHTEPARSDAAARAKHVEASGDLDGAARILEPAVREDRHNHLLPLQLAWVDFRLARYSDAEANYRLTIERGGASPAAHAGLGWSLVRQGRDNCESAAESFRLALAAEPRDTAAKDGLAYCENVSEKKTPSMWLTGNGYLFTDHPWKARAWGATLGATYPVTSRVHVTGAYRFLRLRAADEIPLDPIHQHEAYLQAGYATDTFGVELHGAVITGDTGPFGTSPHVGVLGRYSFYGDVMLDLTESIYADVNVFRASPSWRIPLGSSLHVVPGVAGQRFLEQFAWSGMLTVTYDQKRVGVWAGGKYGDEYRPAYLSSFVIYDISEHNFWGLWAGGHFRVSDNLDLSVAYSFDRMRDPITSSKSGMHYLSIGPAVTF